MVSISLGDPVDLLSGLAPCFYPAASPWTPPPHRPLIVEPPDPPTDPILWEPLTLSLHETIEDLLGHLFAYSVTPMVGLDGPLSLEASVLMAGASLAPLEARLGLDLTRRPAPAYLLARLRGARETVYYTPEWLGLNRKGKIEQWLTPEGRNAMARLRLSDQFHEGADFHGRISARNAQRYLDYFHDFGTHLIRSIRWGEMLFQVFALNETGVPGVRAVFHQEAGGPQIQGPLALGLAHLTRAPWVQQASPLLTTDDTPDARWVTHHGIWGEGETASLLSSAALVPANRATVLSRLPGRSVIGLTLACQALYLEDFRADAWTRVLRGCLSQRFAHATRVGWRARGGFQALPFLASAGTSSPLVPALAPPGRELGLVLFATAHPETGAALPLTTSSPVAEVARQWKLPFIEGSLVLSDPQGGRACLVEGVWLGTGADGRPTVLGAPAEPDPALLRAQAPALSLFLALARSLLGPVVIPEAAAAVRRTVRWLAEVTAGHDALRELHGQAVGVAWGLGVRGADSLAADPATRPALRAVLEEALALLALRPDLGGLGPATRGLERRIAALRRALPAAQTPDALGLSLDHGIQALHERFARWAALPTLPPPLAAALAAGATLAQAPDPRRLPSGLLPGTEGVAVVWNAVLGLRARHAEARAALHLAAGQEDKAVALLRAESLTAWEVPTTLLEDLLNAVPDLPETERQGMREEATILLDLATSAGLLIEIPLPEQTPLDLRRLAAVLTVLTLARSLGVEIAPLDTLALPNVAARLSQALADPMTPQPC